MWKWLADNWMGLTALLLSFDAERRLYLSTDWGVEKTDGDGWILRNNGWLTERDIRVTPTGGAIVEYRGASKLKRHESGTVIVAMVETSKSRDIRVSSRRILFRHSRILSLQTPARHPRARAHGDRNRCLPCRRRRVPCIRPSICRHQTREPSSGGRPTI